MIEIEAQAQTSSGPFLWGRRVAVLTLLGLGVYERWPAWPNP